MSFRTAAYTLLPLVFFSLCGNVAQAQDDTESADSPDSPQGRFDRPDYDSALQSHRQRASLSFHPSEPVTLLSWFNSELRSTVQCEVYAKGVVHSFLQNQWGIKGGGGNTGNTLSSSEQLELEDALKKIPAGQRFDAVPRENWVLVSCLRKDRWDTRVFDRQALPISVRDVFEIAGATITPATHGQESLVLHGHQTPVVDIAFASDGRKLLTLDAGGTVKTWSMPTGELEGTIHLTAPNTEREKRFPLVTIGLGDPYNTPVSISLDANFVAFGRRSPGIWDLATGRLVVRPQFENQTASVWCNALAFSPDGALLAVDLTDRESTNIGLWDVRSAMSLGVIPINPGTVGAVGFSPDGATLAVGMQGDEGVVMFIDVPSLERKADVNRISHSIDHLRFTRFAQNAGELVVSGSGKATVIGADHTTSFVGPTNLSGWRSLASFSPDATLLATTRSRNLIKLWDLQTGKRLGCFYGHSEYVTAMAYSADGRTLVTGDQGGTIRAWQPGDLQRDSPPTPVLVRDGHYDPIESLMRIPTVVKLDESNQVKEVDFQLYHRDDRDLIPLGKISSLERVILNGWETPGAGLAHLRGLENIRTIELWSHHVTDEALPHIGKLTSLQELSLRHTAISNSGLAHLTELNQLKSLLLHKTAIDDAGLAHLARHENLELLSLHRTQVTDAGIVHLANLTNLRDLSLAGTAIDGSGLVHLRGLANLRTLRVWETQIGDAALEHLLQLKQLKTLLLYNTRLSKSSLKRLRSELSSTDVKF